MEGKRVGTCQTSAWRIWVRSVIGGEKKAIVVTATQSIWGEMMLRWYVNKENRVSKVSKVR